MSHECSENISKKKSRKGKDKEKKVMMVVIMMIFKMRIIKRKQNASEDKVIDSIVVVPFSS